MKHQQHSTPITPLTTLSHAVSWSQHLLHLHQRIAPRFVRPEPRQRVLAFLQALLTPIERKNCWHVAEQARETTPYGMQRLLARAVWDADLVRDDLRTYAVELLGTQDLILAIDETSFPKRGSKSAGVKNQYCGSTGHVENCQVGVFLTVATALGHTLIDRALYIPHEWLADPPRCREAGIPETIRFQTKPELAIQLLQRSLDAALPVTWVVADSVYGGNPSLRAWLHTHHLPYVMAIAYQEPVVLSLPDGACRRVEAGAVPTLLQASLVWQRLSMHEGTKGPRLYDWTATPLLHQGLQDGQHWLLLRRPLDDPGEITSFLVFAPLHTTLLAMVRAWGARWHIEEDFAAAKDLGLDHFQVRTWTACLRHLTLVLLALAFLRGLALPTDPPFPPISPGQPVPLSPHEIRLILARLLWPAPSSCSFVLHWSAWRRSHQGRARFFHFQRRIKAGSG